MLFISVFINHHLYCYLDGDKLSTDSDSEVVVTLSYEFAFEAFEKSTR